MFCRNCGKELIGTPETCANCGAGSVKATAFCRFCGGDTNVQTIWCPKCGAALRIIARSGEASDKEGRGRFTTTKTVLKILAAVIFVSWYAVMALPPRTALKPLQAATSSVVVASTGYTALPLTGLSVTPPTIPPLRSVENFYMPVGTDVNATHQLTVYAVYKNTTSSNGTKATRLEDVTNKAVYKSSDERIATVNAAGFVRAVGSGSANITVSYTAAPGSPSLATASEGKVPITVTFTVPVLVK